MSRTAACHAGGARGSTDGASGVFTLSTGTLMNPRGKWCRYSLGQSWNHEQSDSFTLTEMNRQRPHSRQRRRQESAAPCSEADSREVSFQEPLASVAQSEGPAFVGAQ
eukprot:scaffold3131_cov91-Phaeocystis_antarctica.AAC.1